MVKTKNLKTSTGQIGILIDQIRYGGVEKVAINEVIGLRELGINAVLVVLKRGAVENETFFKEQLGNIPIIYLSDRIPKILQISTKFPFFAFLSLYHITFPIFATVKIKEREFDAIVAHGSTTCFMAIALSKFKGIPYIAYIWDPINHVLQNVYSIRNRENLMSALFISFGRFADKMIVCHSVSTLTASETHQHYLEGLGSKKQIRILHPSTRMIDHPSSEKQDYVVLFTAWKKGKNPELIFKIAKRVAALKFVVAGAWLSISHKQRFINESRTLGLDDRIQVTGAVTEEKRMQLMKNALVFLQITKDIGFGMPALEAAACGCTFIIPEGQGVCTIFRQGTDGLFVKEEDEEEVVRILQYINSDKDWAVRMGFNAWARAKENSWFKHATSLSEILKTVTHRDIVNSESLRH